VTDRTGQILAGRYRILRELGSGGMGTVYLAEHVYLGRPTALKLLRPELARVQDAEARFRREALLAARINHPAVAQVYDFDCTPDGEFLLAMEYVEGETVGLRLRRDGPFAMGHGLQVLQILAEGLDRAHGLGVLHRDIKPENVMLPIGGGAKLLDFGVARPMETSSGATSPGLVVGTPAYMSPEQLAGDPVGPASDLYALGLVFYEMLSGRRPHEAESVEELRVQRLVRPTAPLHLVRPEIPAALSEVVARALDPEPKARWPSATEFARAAAGSAASPQPVAAAVSPVDTPLDRWGVHVEALRFAGRDHEIRQVRDAWAAARAGRPTLLWIEGDDGAGKSAFLELARREAAEDGAGRLIGRGYEADVARPYGAWIPLLRKGLQLRAAEARAWPAISALTDGDARTPAPSRLELYDEVAALVRAAGGRGPLLVGLEDLEWCDPASLSLFEFLVQDLQEGPILLAVTAIAGAARGGAGIRDLRERLRRLDNVAWVALRPLGYEAVAAWLSQALGGEAADELVRYVYGHTEGNAFFIEQVVRSLIERGDIDRVAREGSRLRLEDESPPEAVTEVVRRRLAGMSPAAREILQIAAVVGREFDVDLLLAVATRGEDTVLDSLDEAQAAGILAPVPRPTGDWYRFTHNKLAEVLAQAMNLRRRRRLHARVAEELARRPDTLPATLAWHWYRAGELARTSEAARAAARHALAAHDYEDAVAFGALAAEAAGSAEDERQAHELRGDALSRLDRHGEAAAAYAHARLTGRVDGEESIALRGKELRAALLAGTTSPAVALEEARRIATLAGSAAPAVRGRVELLLAEAFLATRQPEAAERAARRAGALFQEAQDPVHDAEALLAVASACLNAGALAEAEQAASEAALRYRGFGDPYGLVRAATLQSAVAVARGDPGGARAALGEALQQARRARVTGMVRQIHDRLQELNSHGRST